MLQHIMSTAKLSGLNRKRTYASVLYCVNIEADETYCTMVSLVDLIRLTRFVSVLKFKFCNIRVYR